MGLTPEERREYFVYHFGEEAQPAYVGGGLNSLDSWITGVGITTNANKDYQLVVLTRFDDNWLTAHLPVFFKKFGLDDPPPFRVYGCDPMPCARPAKGGDSIGDSMGSRGTLGCQIDNQSGRFMLSCNHVLANLNRGIKGSDVTKEPSGGSRIGLLEDFCPIDFTPGASNVIDAAISKPDDPADVICNIGSCLHVVPRTTGVDTDTKVKKYGAASRRTDGNVMAWSVAFEMPYSATQKALFENQVLVTGTGSRFARRGDSGAIILDDQDSAVGLLFGTDGVLDVAYVNPISAVLDYFKANIAH